MTNEKEKNLYLSTNKRSLTLRNKNEFITKTFKKINYVAINTNTVTSIGTSLIPFIENNDGNRTLMGSNMQKQAIPINKKERPLIQTGKETKISTESPYLTRTKKEGIYKYCSKKKIIIKEIETKTINNPNQSYSTITKRKESIKRKLNTIKENQTNKLKTYKLENNHRNNQSLYTNQKAINKYGKWVKKGEIISNNTHIEFGKLSLGKNLLVAYMPLEGYNFEDAIIINRKIVKEESLTSMHIKKYLSFILDNEIGKVRK